MASLDVSTVQAQVAEQSQTIIKFLREICAIPSMDSQIGPVGERIQEEMRSLGFEATWRRYPMQHQVCAEEIADLADWMSARFAAG